MCHCCPQTLIFVLNKLASATAKFQILTNQFRPPVAIFLHPASYVFMRHGDTWPCFHVGGMSFLL